ncbi:MULTISPECIES: DUF6880 family protein [Rhizobium]|uniref:Conserved protein n=1 Tax=Rhizobium favelukesii TaxID=348824 RepID=W6RHC4_9HYPH|nr:MULTISPECIES: DUF6880 family protein [Rhizobium]MCS0457134.1 hypothetical protein [Rhizobium favelukesii]UFS82645.1 hypothetical protein LPB79_10105 [Rhizobium sp. T136]CDM59780.1 putative conserved protein [Rhizobium favelukesii]
MAPKTTLNAKNLEALGAKRLAELLIDISTGSAAHKRRLRIELAGKQSSAEVAREVTKRLSSIERSRSVINWRRVKALKSDLETQRHVIVDTIASSDPDEALEVMWRFMGLARSIFERCDDGNGTIMDVFYQTCVDLGTIANAARPDPRLLAEQTFRALQGNDYGQYDRLIENLSPALGAEGLDWLKSLFDDWAKAPVDAPAEAGRVVIGWGSSGPVYEDEINLLHRDRTIRSALEQIADAQGDVDAFIAQQSEQARSVPTIAAEIAQRLLKADPAGEAWDAINRVEMKGRPSPFEWEEARLDVLEALSRSDEAQAFRWQCFEQSLNERHLRAFLKRLPDFDDLEAEENAFNYVSRFQDVHQALAFLVSWPALDKAATLVRTRAAELDGDPYELLTPASEHLQEKYPLAATIALRVMIDFTLDRAKSSRYRFAARHLFECERLSTKISDFDTFTSHPGYVAELRGKHAKKTGFWTAAGP